MVEVPRSWQRMGLSGVTLQMKVGVAAVERHPDHRQPITVDVDLYRFAGHLPVAGLDDTLDYDRLHRHLHETWPARPHTDLLESLAEDLIAFGFEDARVDAVRVKLGKPTVYGGRGVPEEEVFRLRADQPPR